MKKRPYSLWIISLALLLTGPLSFFVSSDPKIWAIAAVGTLLGVGVWRVRLWGYFGFLAYSAALLIFQLYSYVMSPDPSLYLSLVAGASVAGVAAFLLQKHLTAPYFNPHLRWWETDPRFHVDLHIELLVEGHSRKGKVLDISRGGCFLCTDTRLIVGEVLGLKVRFKDLQMEVPAEVIWASKNPEGYGLRFILARSEQKKHTKRLVQTLTHEAPLATTQKTRTAA